MTTTPDAREVLRAWRDKHNNVQPARGNERCIQQVWFDDKPAGECGKPAAWIVNYSYRVRQLGYRPHCEEHTVAVIRKWAAFERGEVPA